jgi:8-oxo-dGTP diphosphatase
LIKRGTDPYRGTWALPGGVIEYGESPREAAVRELAEETNVTVDPSALVSSTTRKGPGSDDHFDITTSIVTFVVTQANTDGELTAGTAEHADRFWTLEEIREDLRPGEAERIQRAIQTLEQ